MSRAERIVDALLDDAGADFDKLAQMRTFLDGHLDPALRARWVEIVGKIMQEPNPVPSRGPYDTQIDRTVREWQEGNESWDQSERNSR